MLAPLLAAVLAALVAALALIAVLLAVDRQRLRRRLMRAWVRGEAMAASLQAERRRSDALLARLARLQGDIEALRDTATAVAIAAQLDALHQRADWHELPPPESAAIAELRQCAQN